MSITINTSTRAVNWETLLSSLGDVQKPLHRVAHELRNAHDLVRIAFQPRAAPSAPLRLRNGVLELRHDMVLPEQLRL